MKNKAESFKPTLDNKYYLAKRYNKSKTINQALFMYRKFLEDPKYILKELKQTNPILYKQIGRRKF